MNPTPQKETFRDLVNNQPLCDFARQIIVESYTQCTPGHEAQMQALLDEAFDRLEAGAHDDQAFAAQVRLLVSDVFRKAEPDFWFNQVYQHYKRTIKPQRRFEHLRLWLQAPHVLDFGCGDGQLSVVLSQNGYTPHLTDVLDYRAESARHLPFEPMAGTLGIPFSGQTFDSALVMAVLHHIQLADLPTLLHGLSQRCRRVIIEEDCYAVPPSLLREALPTGQTSQLQAFTSLSQDDQLRYLMFIDYFSNAITQGIPEMEMPFNFRTVTDWQQVFEAHGYKVCKVLLLGFQKGNFSRSCHTWFVLDSLAGQQP